MLVTAATVSTTLVLVMTGRAGPLAAALAVQLVYAGALLRRTEEVLQSAERHSRDLDVLGQVLKRLERERFETPQLADLRRRLDTERQAASAAIHALRRLVELNQSRALPLMSP